MCLLWNVSICLSRRGWIEDFQAPRFPIHGSRESRIPNGILIYLETEAWPKLRLLEAEEEVLPGITARSVGVPRARWRSRIAFSNTQQNLPLGIQESMEECVRTYAMIRKQADVVTPLYVPEIPTRHAGGKVA